MSQNASDVRADIGQRESTFHLPPLCSKLLCSAKILLCVLSFFSRFEILTFDARTRIVLEYLKHCFHGIFLMDPPQLWTKLKYKDWLHVFRDDSKNFTQLCLCSLSCGENGRLTWQKRDISLFRRLPKDHLDHHKATLAESRALHGEGLGGAGVSLVEVIVIVVVGHPDSWD